MLQAHAARGHFVGGFLVLAGLLVHGLGLATVDQLRDRRHPALPLDEQGPSAGHLLLGVSNTAVLLDTASPSRAMKS